MVMPSEGAVANARLGVSAPPPPSQRSPAQPCGSAMPTGVGPPHAPLCGGSAMDDCHSCSCDAYRWVWRGVLPHLGSLMLGCDLARVLLEVVAAHKSTRGVQDTVGVNWRSALSFRCLPSPSPLP